MRKNGLRAIGLSFLAVLGLMAFMGASAQANWLELGAETTVNKEVLVAKHVTPILDVPADKLEKICQKVIGDDALILAKSSKVTGTLLFTECETRINNVSQPLCKPVEPITVTGTGELVLNGARNELLFKPLSGQPFTTIKLPETCALPPSSKVNGTLLAECLKASNLEKVDCKQEEKVHLFQQDTGSEDKLTYGSGLKAANLLGVVKAELISGNTWAGHV